MPGGQLVDWLMEGPLTAEGHKRLVRRFFEAVWNAQRLDLIEEVFAPTAIVSGQPIARDAIRQLVATRRTSFPDISVTVNEQIAEGDKVSTRRTWEATHQRPYRGIAPTASVCYGCRSVSFATLRARLSKTG